MANMGCTVRAFDLYVDSKEDEFLGHPNITFSYVGLSNVKGRIQIGVMAETYIMLISSEKIYDAFSFSKELFMNLRMTSF